MADRLLEKVVSVVALGASALIAFGVGVLLARSSGFASHQGIWPAGLGSVAALFLAAGCSREAFAPDAGRWPGGEKLPPSTWRGLAYVFLFLGACLGLFLQYYLQTGIYTIPLGGLGVFMSYFYYAPPLQWYRRPAGELAAGLSFGLLLVLTGFYLQGGHLVSEILFYGLPLTLSAFNLFLIQGFPHPASEAPAPAGSWWTRRRPVAAGLAYTLVNVLTIIALVFCVIFPAYPLATRTWLWALILLAVFNQETIKRRGYLREDRIRLVGRLSLVLHLGMSVIFALGLWWRL